MACGGETKEENPQDLEKPQSTVITGLFDNNASATVKGTFTNAEWKDIPNKIKASLNRMFGTKSSDTVKEIYKGIFAAGNIIIILEKTDEYNECKVIGDGKTINYNILSDEAYLDVIVESGVSLIYEYDSGMAKVVPVPKYKRVMLV
jgi:hypothetical protein